jgi:hypothetical protein
MKMLEITFLALQYQSKKKIEYNKKKAIPKSQLKRLILVDPIIGQ